MSKDILKIEDKANPTYKTWLYNKIDGAVQSTVVGMDEAEELYKQGWRLSPAEFHDTLGQDPAFTTVVSNFAGKMNQLINIDLINDKKALIELGDVYGLKLKRTMTIKSLKFKIKQASEVEETE